MSQYSIGSVTSIFIVVGDDNAGKPSLPYIRPPKEVSAAGQPKPEVYLLDGLTFGHNLFNVACEHMKKFGENSQYPRPNIIETALNFRHIGCNVNNGVEDYPLF